MLPNTPKPVISRARRVRSGSLKNSTGIWRSSNASNFCLKLSVDVTADSERVFEAELAIGDCWLADVAPLLIIEKEARFVPKSAVRNGRWWSRQASEHRLQWNCSSIRRKAN